MLKKTMNKEFFLRVMFIAYLNLLGFSWLD